MRLLRRLHCQRLWVGPDQVVVLVIPVQCSCDDRGEIQRSVPSVGGIGLRELAEFGQSGETGRAAAFSLDDQPAIEFFPNGRI
ncbi:hypothetical protein AB0I61_34755 [Polymorphospora rubra]|uniref:hypothetical protein n=1 Tax=Polymorphospora rubra TaxID=338584 RepID=UPI0033C1E254